jgi:hypothetical protein
MKLKSCFFFSNLQNLFFIIFVSLLTNICVFYIYSTKKIENSIWHLYSKWPKFCPFFQLNVNYLYILRDLLLENTDLKSEDNDTSLGRSNVIFERRPRRQIFFSGPNYYQKYTDLLTANINSVWRID